MRENTGKTLFNLETYETSQSEIVDTLTFCLEDSRARIYQRSIKKGLGFMVNVLVYGENSQDLLLRYDQKRFCWKTWSLFGEEDSTLSSATLPLWGMMRDGALYQLQSPELRIGDVDGGWWGTPLAWNSKSLTNLSFLTIRPDKALINLKNSMSVFFSQQTMLIELKRLGLEMSKLKNFQINPEFVEMLMGYPPGWTDISGHRARFTLRGAGSRRELLRKKCLFRANVYKPWVTRLCLRFAIRSLSKSSNN